MILLNTALFAVVCAAALWPRETLKQLIILDYSIRLFWIDCQIAWVTFWLILRLRRAGLDVPLSWGSLWPEREDS